MALRSIHLRDFVIVPELALDLARGFSVLTGETGAGKSILIDALQLALGARADAGVVREGATRAEVSAEFDAPASAGAWLLEAGFDAGEPAPDVVLVRRVVDAQGKSRGWINGSVATATQLRELGEHLLDIHGQHAWQSLTRPDAVRALLDAYAQADPQPVSEAWQGWRRARQTLTEAQAAQDTLQRERERLAWQIAEGDKLAPGADEWAALNAQHGRLANAQSLIEHAAQALRILDGGDESGANGSPREGGASAALVRATDALAAQADIEPEFAVLADQLAVAQAQVHDALHTLRTWLSRTEPDPQQLEALDARLAQWLALARRYRLAPEALPAALQGWRDELARLDAATDLGQLQEQEQQAGAAYAQAAKALSAQRKAAAPRLTAAVTSAMQTLGMPGGRFEVALQTTEPMASGTEDVTFLVAGHAGVTPRPVGKVASGGELSRIALAIAVTTSTLCTVDTLIFDEVDAGVGGAVAHTVGALMRRLGRDRQVLAVTHLPQVAACADQHLLVSKQMHAGRVASQVQPVSSEARVAELARMLGGASQGAATLAHARVMLEEGAAATAPPSLPTAPALTNRPASPEAKRTNARKVSTP